MGLAEDLDAYQANELAIAKHFERTVVAKR